MMTNILSFLLWFGVWMLLTWPPSAANAVIGIFASAIVSFITSDMIPPKVSPLRNPLRYLWFIYYIIIFLWECLKANIDVAYRVIHPGLPIRPGTLRVKTGLKSDAGLTFLANSITLTPGTTSVDIDKENGYIYVHWLSVKDGLPGNRLPVAEKFENILKRIFE
ncbi:MAG: Na+/H+ antiporter subunit E [Candidatus Omnitrophota bacterium]|nr:Na+/H+ antiporter subunit E [Candidatus Omnitrophota bacterium]